MNVTDVTFDKRIQINTQNNTFVQKIKYEYNNERLTLFGNKNHLTKTI